MTRPDKINTVDVPYGEEFDRLIQMVRERDSRWGAALVALAHSEAPLARQAIQEFARSRDEFLRRATLEAVARSLSREEAVELVLQAFDDSSTYVVRTACHLSGELQITEARRYVLRLLSSKEIDTRLSAAWALKVIGIPEDFHAVIDCYHREPVPYYKHKIAWALRATVSYETSKPFIALFRNDKLPRHRVWVCEVSSEYGGGSHEVLVSMLQDPDGHVRKAAARALKKIDE